MANKKPSIPLPLTSEEKNRVESVRKKSSWSTIARKIPYNTDRNQECLAEHDRYTINKKIPTDIQRRDNAILFRLAVSVILELAPYFDWNKAQVCAYVGISEKSLKYWLTKTNSHNAWRVVRPPTSDLERSQREKIIAHFFKMYPKAFAEVENEVHAEHKRKRQERSERAKKAAQDRREAKRQESMRVIEETARIRQERLNQKAAEKGNTQIAKN